MIRFVILRWLLAIDYMISGLGVASGLAWLILANVNFAYPWLHDVLDIEQHSLIYGPRNHYRQDFQLTNRNEKIRLFALINQAIHDNGKGLDRIQYYSPDDKRLGAFLRPNEITHLKDVAILINKLQWVTVACLITWLLLLCFYFYYQYPPPTVKRQWQGALSGLLLLLVGTLLVGPTELFYQLHLQVFPADHQWFFYYEESLMSTLMKAPDLFAAIGLLWLLLTLLCWYMISRLGTLATRESLT